MNKEKKKQRALQEELAAQCFQIKTYPGKIFRVSGDHSFRIYYFQGEKNKEGIFQEINFGVKVNRDALQVFLDYQLELRQLKESSKGTPEQIKRRLLVAAGRQAWSYWHRRPPGNRCPYFS